MNIKDYPYACTKTYGHERGFSVAFRQWRATNSHCRYVHGYSLAVEIEFRAKRLDHRGWVIDFGGLELIEDWLRCNFDHKLVVADDDPQLYAFKELQSAGAADVIVWPNGVGCEKFAARTFYHVRDFVSYYLEVNDLAPDSVVVHHVTISEHGSNSATHYNKDLV